VVAASVEAGGRPDPDRAREGGPASDPRAGIRRLEVVEHLRPAHGLRGALASFTADEDGCVVTFEGPGHATPRPGPADGAGRPGRPS
jgi:hypothetical protein